MNRGSLPGGWTWGGASELFSGTGGAGPAPGPSVLDWAGPAHSTGEATALFFAVATILAGMAGRREGVKRGSMRVESEEWRVESEEWRVEDMSMGIENGRVLGTESGRVRALPHRGSGSSRVETGLIRAGVALGSACFRDPALKSPPTRLGQCKIHTTPGSHPGLHETAATLLYREDL